MNDNEATLTRVGERPILRFERHLRHPIETVWRAVTDPVEMRSWFPTRIEIDEWKVGASLTHHFDGHDIGPLAGVVVEWDPPRRASFTWGDDTIGFELVADPEGGTTFVLSEELSANHAARNAAGWEACLDHLEDGTERQSWPERFERYVAVFEPILGHQEGPPAGHRDPATAR
jgi:uncharacterized protein YndB with AHSA1/START domain